MAVGGGFAVGVTVVPVDDAPSPWERADPEPSRPVEALGAWLPRRRPSAQSAGLMQQVTAAEAKLAALKLGLALDIAADRPAPVDPRAGKAGVADVGPDGVSEFVLDELALILNTSRTAAVLLLDQAQIFAPPAGDLGRTGHRSARLAACPGDGGGAGTPRRRQ